MEIFKTIEYFVGDLIESGTSYVVLTKKDVKTVQRTSLKENFNFFHLWDSGMTCNE